MNHYNDYGMWSKILIEYIPEKKENFAISFIYCHDK